MKVYKINTTAFFEEDFYLMTDLSEQDITEVVQPLVNAERDGYEEYDNEKILKALNKRYPKNQIIMFTEFEELIY